MIIVERLIREKRVPEAPIYIDGMLWDVTGHPHRLPGISKPEHEGADFPSEQNPFLSLYLSR